MDFIIYGKHLCLLNCILVILELIGGIIEVLWGIVGDHWGYKLHRGIFEINLCCISDKKLINNVYT